MPATDLNQAHKDCNAPPADFNRDTLSGVDVSKRYVSVVIEDTVVHAFVDSVGSISVNLNIAHEPMTHALQVVRNSTKPLILGWDFLVANGIIVDTRKVALIVDDKVVPLVSQHQ